MKRNAKDNKCQLIVRMPADDFLTLTTGSKAGRDQISQSANSVRAYNRWAKIGDNKDYANFVNKGKERGTDDYEYGATVHPFLSIVIYDDSGHKGHVTGHEGRHRAAAMIKGGGTHVEVALCMKPGRNTLPDVRHGVEYHLTSEHMPKFVYSQYDNSYGMRTDGWEILQDDMQKNVHR